MLSTFSFAYNLLSSWRRTVCAFSVTATRLCNAWWDCSSQMQCQLQENGVGSDHCRKGSPEFHSLRTAHRVDRRWLGSDYRSISWRRKRGTRDTKQRHGLHFQHRLASTISYDHRPRPAAETVRKLWENWERHRASPLQTRSPRGKRPPLKANHRQALIPDVILWQL